MKEIILKEKESFFEKIENLNQKQKIKLFAGGIGATAGLITASYFFRPMMGVSVAGCMLGMGYLVKQGMNIMRYDQINFSQVDEIGVNIDFFRLEGLIRANQKTRPFFARAGKKLIKRFVSNPYKDMTDNEFKFLMRIHCFKAER